MKSFKPDPKFNKGERVYVETIGFCKVHDSYWVKGEVYYHLTQKGFDGMLGNVPETYIHPMSDVKPRAHERVV